MPRSKRELSKRVGELGAVGDEACILVFLFSLYSVLIGWVRSLKAREGLRRSAIDMKI